MFADAQSLESQYGKSGSAGGALASGLLKLRAKKVRRSDAVQLPRFVTIAVGEKAVHLFAHRKTADGVEPYIIGSIARGSLETEIKQGLFWTRLTLIDREEGRSYMAFQGRIMPRRKALVAALRQLSGTIRRPRSRPRSAPVGTPFDGGLWWRQPRRPRPPARHALTRRRGP
jgi:hypothetical protein